MPAGSRKGPSRRGAGSSQNEKKPRNSTHVALVDHHRGSAPPCAHRLDLDPLMAVKALDGGQELAAGVEATDCENAVAVLDGHVPAPP